MFLTLFDLILILIIFIFIAFGFVMGLVQAIGSVVGIIFGAWAAAVYFQPLGLWLDKFIPGDDRVALVVAFIIIFVIISRLCGLFFYLLDKIFHLISFIPFLKGLNRLVGALFGLVEGVLVLGLVLYVVTVFFPQGFWQQIIAGSKVASWLLLVAKIFVPLLPAVLKKIKTVV